MPPIILSDNLLAAAGTLSASDTATGYDVANVIDKRGYTYWRAANLTTGTKYIKNILTGTAAADCLAIYGHNFHTASVYQIRVQWSSDGNAWTTVLTIENQATDRAILATFTSPGVKKYWQVTLNDYTPPGGYTAIPQAAIVMIGLRLDLPTPPDAPFTPARVTQVAASGKSETGNILGNAIKYKKVSISAKFSMLTNTFIATYFWPFWRDYASSMYPFFWAWDLTNFPADVYLVRLVDNAAYESPRSYSGWVDGIDLEMEGLLEE